MAPAINETDPIVRMCTTSPVYRRLPGHHILWIEGGTGIYQVDFQNYSYTGERILFLEPGQYFRVLAGTFAWKDVAVPSSLLTQHPGLAAVSRVLFTHVFEVGAIAPAPGLPPLPPPAEEHHLETWLRCSSGSNADPCSGPL